MPLGNPGGIFALSRAYRQKEVMQRGEPTARVGKRPAGTHFIRRTYIENHLFQRSRFGTFFNRLSGLLPVSCVLERGGERA